jgi:hypothetical protein
MFILLCFMAIYIKINYLLCRLLPHEHPCCTLWGGWLPHQLCKGVPVIGVVSSLGRRVSDRYQYVHRSSLSISTTFDFLPPPIHVMFD